MRSGCKIVIRWIPQYLVIIGSGLGAVTQQGVIWTNAD